MDVGRGKGQECPGPQAGGVLALGQPAPEVRALDPGDPEPERLPGGRPRAGQEGEPDAVPDAQPADGSPELDVIDADEAPHLLDVLDGHRLADRKSTRLNSSHV